MKKATILALIAVTALALTSSVLFIKQGGFGAGHARYDIAIAFLGLPWVMLPWPDAVEKLYPFWLIGLPWLLNVATVLIISVLVNRIQRKRGSNVVGPAN